MNTFITPVVRWVQGSLYDARDKDLNGNPLKSKAGKDRVVYFFAVACPKKSEKDWKETEWGKTIMGFVTESFPGRQHLLPSFSWKIEDGDSEAPNEAGKRNCDTEGFPGNWIIKSNSGYAPVLCEDKGTKPIVTRDKIKKGDYIQVAFNLNANLTGPKYGLFIGADYVNFIGKGEQIQTRVLVDPSTLGFGNAPVPAECSLIPHAEIPPSAPAIPVTAVPIVPHTAILTPPVPARTMTDKCNGMAYETFIANGWTDVLLIQHGYMLP